jgi:hypothetical protein
MLSSYFSLFIYVTPLNTKTSKLSIKKSHLKIFRFFYWNRSLFYNSTKLLKHIYFFLQFNRTQVNKYSHLNHLFTPFTLKFPISHNIDILEFFEDNSNLYFKLQKQLYSSVTKKSTTSKFLSTDTNPRNIPFFFNLVLPSVSSYIYVFLFLNNYFTPFNKHLYILDSIFNSKSNKSFAPTTTTKKHFKYFKYRFLFKFMLKRKKKNIHTKYSFFSFRHFKYSRLYKHRYRSYHLSFHSKYQSISRRFRLFRSNILPLNSFNFLTLRHRNSFFTDYLRSNYWFFRYTIGKYLLKYCKLLQINLLQSKAIISGIVTYLNYFYSFTSLATRLTSINYITTSSSYNNMLIPFYKFIYSFLLSSNHVNFSTVLRSNSKISNLYSKYFPKVKLRNNFKILTLLKQFKNRKLSFIKYQYNSLKFYKFYFIYLQIYNFFIFSKLNKFSVLKLLRLKYRKFYFFFNNYLFKSLFFIHFNYNL